MLTKKKARKPSRQDRFIGKPTGQIQERVRRVGPEHFGIVAVDCAKRRSKWMLCDYYGKVLVEPTIVEHTSGGLRTATQLVRAACKSMQLTDAIIAVEMTGIYHKPVQRAFREAGFDTRTVHPFASSHYRKPLHPDLKTDDHDLEAIFHAAVKGYGLCTLPVNGVYSSLQSLSRHRQNLVKQRARTMIQIRQLMHQTMPGFADLYDDNKFFHQSIALPVALRFPSAEAIKQAGRKRMAKHLASVGVRCQSASIDRVIAWASDAADSSELASLLTRQWQDLDQVRRLLSDQIMATEQEMSGFLAKTPYVLLLSVTGIHVVSAARLAGEAGPIELYATSRALTGRAGLYPSRYQSDEVDHDQGTLVRQCNRRLRSAAMLIAENLIKCHPHFRGLSSLWTAQKVDPRDRRCRIANRAMRMVFQLVSGGQYWRGHGIPSDRILAKLQEFHRVHKTCAATTIHDMQRALQWIPKSAHAHEAEPFLTRTRRCGPRRLGDLLLPVLARLGVAVDEAIEGVKSNTSEARSSD